jgi:metal-responsive CopG/Arc/MetJ family transcriptional regulator
MSVVVRLPEDLYANVKKIAALQGRQPSDVLTEAWQQYLSKHRDELAASFEEAAALLRSGDTAGLTELASRSVETRAEGAATAVRRKRRDKLVSA